MQFLMVYIREAHAVDGRSPNYRGPLVEDPISDDERQEVAGDCVQDLGLEMIPAVVDRVDDEVNQAYQALPDRLYLVGENGEIAYAGGRGPMGFRPDELEAAIEAELEELGKRKADEAAAAKGGVKKVPGS